MNISGVLALPLTAILSILAAWRALASLREGQIAWGNVATLVLQRRKSPGAFWFSVGVLVFLALSLALVSIHLALAVLAGA